MIKLVADDWNFHIEKKELIDLELSVIHLLDFDLSYIGPIQFLERFQRIYNLDQVRKDSEAQALE